MEFKYVEGHHYGEILGKKIYDVLKEYDICQKLFCITADGASNNGTIRDGQPRFGLGPVRSNA